MQGGRPSSLETIVEAILGVLEEPYERQKKIGFWSVDFYIPRLNLVIECDGTYWHGSPEAKTKRSPEGRVAIQTRLLHSTPAGTIDSRRARCCFYQGRANLMNPSLMESMKEIPIPQPEMIMMPNIYGIDPYTSVTIVDAVAGIVRYDPPRRKVAIIGAGPSRHEAPYDDPEWVMWGLNEIAQKRATAWHELHPAAVQSARDLAWLRQCPTPCYVLDLAEWDGLIPRPVQFPLDRIKAAGFRPYFTCTFAMQIALAILGGFEEIGLWGVSLHLGTPRERLLERLRGLLDRVR